MASVAEILEQKQKMKEQQTQAPKIENRPATGDEYRPVWDIDAVYLKDAVMIWGVANATSLKRKYQGTETTFEVNVYGIVASTKKQDGTSQRLLVPWSNISYCALKG